MFERGQEGGVELRLSRDERSLLAGLVAELRALLDGAPGDPSLRRLFPLVYDEADDERAYRDLMGGELLDGRRAALELVARDRRPRPAQRRGGRRLAAGAERPAPRPRHAPRRAGGHVPRRATARRPARASARGVRLPLLDPGAAGRGTVLVLHATRAAEAARRAGDVPRLALPAAVDLLVDDRRIPAEHSGQGRVRFGGCVAYGCLRQRRFLGITREDARRGADLRRSYVTCPRPGRSSAGRARDRAPGRARAATYRGTARRRAPESTRRPSRAASPCRANGRCRSPCPRTDVLGAPVPVVVRVVGLASARGA